MNKYHIEFMNNAIRTISADSFTCDNGMVLFWRLSNSSSEPENFLATNTSHIKSIGLVEEESK